MDRKVYKILSAFLLLFSFAACKKDELPKGPSSTSNAPATSSPEDRYVYVACEGSLGNGNASLTMQNLTTLEVYNDAYFKLNAELLGDVFQSIEKIGDKLFLCINNSDKIIVLDAKTRKQVGNISVPKPRYILPINDNKAYVSSLFSNKVYIIDPQNMKLIGSIEMPAQNPEGMVLHGSRAFICTWDTTKNYIYTVNILTDKVEDSIKVAGVAPQEPLIDHEGFLWVFAGNVPNKKWATLTRIALGSYDIVESYKFDVLQDPVRPVLSNKGDIIYFIGVDYNGNNNYNGVFKMPVNSHKLPSSPFIPGKKYQYYWALGVDPISDDIYVGDPKGFIQNGTVTVFDKSGTQKRVFETGVGPGHFYFDR